MEYARLGNSDIEVSKLCLGCMSFGDPASNMHAWTLSLGESEKIIRHALDLGINFFDTANSYSAGTSEEYLGRAIKRNAVRDKVVLASKVYYNEGALSAGAIEREIEGTLKRLGTDYLDLYIIHRFDYNTPVEETLYALDKLVKAGKVRALGASAMFGYQFHNLQTAAEKNGLTGFVSMQNHYNPLYREDERELIPVCRQYGVSLTPYSPLAAGRVARAELDYQSERRQTDKIARAKYDNGIPEDGVIVARIKELADRYGASMTQIALAWHFAKGVTAPVVGATKEKYLDDAAGAFDVKLTKEDADYIDERYVPHRLTGVILPPSVIR